MVRATIVVRELGGNRSDFSLKFDLAELPRVGDYISIYRPDKEFHTEDLVVRYVWWALRHPETAAVAADEKVGDVRDIFVECDQAIGPYANDRWRETLLKAKGRGLGVVEFDVSRVAFSEADMAKK